MKKKGTFVLLMLVCCFSPFINTVDLMAHTGAQAETLSFNGPWSFGKIVAWMFVALIAFIMLLIFYKVITSSIQDKKLKKIKTREKTSEITSSPQVPASFSKEDSKDVYAAIAMALYELREDVHDVENTTLTFHKVDRTYSPWNSKIYGMREIPARR
jgi:hypothetical protein